MAQKKLEAISGEELMDMRLEPLRFCVDTLLPQGVCVLGGASKIGKSWMVLDWCVRIAKGEPVLGQATHGGTTLYLCLEDTCRRVQDRLNRLTDEVPANAYFVTGSETLHQGLLDQIRSFVEEHPDTVLVAVDTLQIIRDTEGDQSYANDYQEIRMLKALADELGITVLVVHHVRKMGDQDPLNRLTGSTAISGAADTIMVLLGRFCGLCPDPSQRDCGPEYCLYTPQGTDAGQFEGLAFDSGPGGFYHAAAQYGHIGTDQRGDGGGHYQPDSPVCYWLHADQPRGPYPPRCG